jgi:hypothetical protein
MYKFLATALFSLISSTYALQAHADCHGPTAPTTFPESATATEQEVLAAQQSVKQYLSQMETALKCMSDAHLDQNRDLAIDEMQKVAAKFNIVLRAYRARQST